MSKYHIPLNLRKYTIENNDTATVKNVDKELRSLMQWLKINQETYYNKHFTQLIQKIQNENTILKGSLNAVGRSLSIQPPKQAKYQPYNTAEMFRTSILTKTACYLQNELIINIIESLTETIELDNLKPKEVIKEFKAVYPDYKTPTYQQVRLTIERLLKKGSLHSKPSPDGVLNFWTTDTHYSKATNTDKHIYFSLKLENIGQLTLKFDMPQKERFKNGKVTRPNVYLNKKGELTFGFTIQKQAPDLKNSTNYLGIDLGKVESFVSSVIGDKSYSAPLKSNKQVNYLSKKINKLQSLSKVLWTKECLNADRGYEAKYEILRTERLRVRSKLSRLKVERAHYIANQIVELASVYNAVVVFEDLSWVPNSKWDQARVQEFTQDRAVKKGVRVRHVNARNTSQLCVVCKAQVEHSDRFTKCSKCLKVLDRDILASRNIANKIAKKKFDELCQLSVQTRVSKPVTPGHYNQFSKVSKLNNLYNKTE